MTTGAAGEAGVRRRRSERRVKEREDICFVCWTSKMKTIQVKKNESWIG